MIGARPSPRFEGDRARTRPGVGQVRCPCSLSASFVLFRQQRTRRRQKSAGRAGGGSATATRPASSLSARVTSRGPVGQLPIGCNYTWAAETYCDACMSRCGCWRTRRRIPLAYNNLDPVDAVPCEQRSDDRMVAIISISLQPRQHLSTILPVRKRSSKEATPASQHCTCLLTEHCRSYR
jgi:hypothetical protein